MWDIYDQPISTSNQCEVKAAACDAFRDEIYQPQPGRYSETQTQQQNSDTSNPASAARLAREQLTRTGIDPGRVTVPFAVFEPTEWSTTAPDSWHANLVARMINDRDSGLCPGATVSVDHVQKPFQSARFNVANYRDRDLRDFAADITADCFNQYTEYIENARRNGTRVVTISSGVHNIGAIYQECLEEAVTQLVLNPEARPELVRRILGNDADRYIAFARQEREALDRRVADFRRQNQPTGDNVTAQQREEFERRVRAFTREERGRSQSPDASTDEIKTLTGRLRQGISNELQIRSSRETGSSPDGVGMIPQRNLDTIRAAIQRWENTTREAAQNGMVIVIATGNSGTDHYNILARSPHVISVGAADLNNVPGNPQLGHVSPFSSTGNSNYRGLQFDNPTVVAQGSQVPMNHQINVWGSTRNQSTLDGTSVAAPLVGATVALMLTQNPNLSFSEVRDILRQSAQPLPFAPAIQRAAGMLVPNSPFGTLVQDAALLTATAPSSAQGAGLVDMAAAVRAARNRRGN